MLKNNGALREAVSPVLDSGIKPSDFRTILNEMYSTSVSNAPADEIDNYTAKRNTPVFLALQAFLENLDQIDD